MGFRGREVDPFGRPIGDGSGRADRTIEIVEAVRAGRWWPGYLSDTRCMGGGIVPTGECDGRRRWRSSIRAWLWQPGRRKQHRGGKTRCRCAGGQTRPIATGERLFEPERLME